MSNLSIPCCLFLESLPNALEVENLLPVVLASPGIAVRRLLSFVLHEPPENISNLTFFLNSISSRLGINLKSLSNRITSVGDVLMKGKAQYSWPPSTNPFGYCKHYLLFYKASYFKKEVNRIDPSCSVSVPWIGLFIPGKSYWRGRLRTVDLFVLTSLDQLIFGIENINYLLYKTSYLNEEVNCTEPSLQLEFPGSVITVIVLNLWRIINNCEPQKLFLDFLLRRFHNISPT